MKALFDLVHFWAYLPCFHFWEITTPGRELLQLRRFRWLSNMRLVVISSILVRIAALILVNLSAFRVKYKSLCN